MSDERRYLLTREAGVEVELEALPDDPLTEREERAAGRDRSLMPPAPAWFSEMLKRDASPKEVLVALRDRLAEVEDLRQAQSIINEVGRLPSGGRLVRRFVTQDVFDRLRQERPDG